MPNADCDVKSDSDGPELHSVVNSHSALSVQHVSDPHDQRPPPVGHLLHRPRRLPRRDRRRAQRQLDHPQLARGRAGRPRRRSSSSLIIAGVVLNTIFLVREIRRNEQHDAFINAVTHELKTPVASIRLYLQTLQTPRARRGEAARVLPHHAGGQRPAAAHDRAGAAGRAARARAGGASRARRVDLGEIATECVELARTRFHLAGRRADLRAARARPARASCSATGRAEGGGLEPDRQRHQVLGGDVHVARGARGGRRRRAGRARDATTASASRRPSSSGSSSASTASRRSVRHPREGHRPRPVHRPLGRARARRQGVRRERRAGPGQHVHAAAAEGAEA